LNKDTKRNIKLFSQEIVMEIKTFRDLIAWQKAMELTKHVYRVTTQMPESERFGLTSQIRRAAVSIPSNIAEGYARQSRVDYIRFLKTARGSLVELQTQIILSEQLSLVQFPSESTNLLAETDRVLQGLIRSLENLKK
jgi:four helix bundle protein